MPKITLCTSIQIFNNVHTVVMNIQDREINYSLLSTIFVTIINIIITVITVITRIAIVVVDIVVVVTGVVSRPERFCSPGKGFGIRVLVDDEGEEIVF